jgi:hypothetical protein
MSSATAGIFPPDEQTIAIQRQVPGRRVIPGAIILLDGAGAGGPEQAGALSLVYATFKDNANAQRGYRRFAAIHHHLVAAPGFLRWITFVDGVHGYALGMWRQAKDVEAFVRSDVHRRMVREQLTDPFQHSQFAGVWTTVTPTRRTLTCDGCSRPTPAPARCCTSCGAALHDPFAASDD